MEVMKGIEVFRFLCWFCGLIILGIGIYLKVNNTTTSGLTDEGICEVSGNGAIFVGVSFLICYILVKIFIKIEK